LAELAGKHDVGLIDTPLGGLGPMSVRSGSMLAFAGGDDHLIDRLEPTLAVFTERVVRCGPLGAPD
jgi:3-hydroxyisobutyrate dehydrogenase-like beta-hydroxyacid dehydrogenase